MFICLAFHGEAIITKDVIGMEVLTEAVVRSILKKDKVKEWLVNPDTIITPSAREYLNEQKIKLVYTKDEQGLLGISKKNNEKNEINDTEEKKFIPKYIVKDTGGFFEKKPEEMTQLYGNELVLKNHPSILFRGKVDSLQSKILEIQVMADKNKCEKLVCELQEVLQYVRNILKAEVIKEATEEICLFGLLEEDIREMSHNPKKHIGVAHILPDYKMGEILIGLNTIRSGAREVELSSIPLNRKDITKSLNRLSSAVYVMMCRYLSGYYN
ncbi:Cobalamin adenosyltransferase [Petrocella atlantisensis]|uniref:Cobalamin adenosyltransferase n=2 Tax=Petrocella atlantisensis TaxID=2173034 RepID=A0A3P7S106_9FIRM|nr:Cobalamin adenosyltransferase [Petrocella atlantisensis]